MIVDDDQDYAEAIGRLLAARKYEVRIAVGVDEAKSLVARSVPDVVLCDLHMQPLSGDELLRFLVATHPSVRRVLLSASPRRELEAHRELGLAHAIVEKTEPIDVLLAELAAEASGTLFKF